MSPCAPRTSRDHGCPVQRFASARRCLPAGPGTYATCSCGRSRRPRILKAPACQDAWMHWAHGDCEVSFPPVVPVGVWRLQLESCKSSLAGDVPKVTLRQLRIAEVCDVFDLSPWGTF